MQLAKNVIDVGLSTNNLEPMLRFRQQDVGLHFDHELPLRRGSSASDVLHQPALVSKRRITMAAPTKPSSEDRSVQTVLNAFDIYTLSVWPAVDSHMRRAAAAPKASKLGLYVAKMAKTDPQF